MSFIITSKGAHPSVAAVVAPKGYYRLKDGGIQKDGSPSPEMGEFHRAWKFKSHRSAALTAAVMGFPEIREINY